VFSKVSDLILVVLFLVFVCKKTEDAAHVYVSHIRTARAIFGWVTNFSLLDASIT
jgi:hypothetical protein